MTTPVRRAAALAACAFVCAAGASAARPAMAAPPAGGKGRAAGAVVVRPGTLVRWPGDGIEACGVGERRFAPLAGTCYYPVDLLHPPGPLELSRWRAGARETRAVRVGRFDYPVQRLTLPRAMVELSPADAARVRAENATVARLWSREAERRFTLPLHTPLDPLPPGGRFGSRRIINGQRRSPHGGADYSVPAGAPVLAAADGVVAMVADHFFSGHSVFVDHGDRLISMYFHLARVDVREGQALRRGERVGAVGSSGRATGPHLHFGVRWRSARVDPRLLLADPGELPAVE